MCLTFQNSYKGYSFYQYLKVHLFFSSYKNDLHHKDPSISLPTNKDQEFPGNLYHQVLQIFLTYVLHISQVVELAATNYQSPSIPAVPPSPIVLAFLVSFRDHVQIISIAPFVLLVIIT